MRHALLVAALVLLSGVLETAAQPVSRVVRVGYLAAGSTATDPWGPGFVEGLQALGYTDGQNLLLEKRYAEGRFDRLPALAAELVRLRCDVIATAVTQASLAGRDATGTIPIVMIGVADPVAAGLVRASPAPAAMSLERRPSPRRSSASSWSCSGRPFPTRRGSRSCGTRQRGFPGAAAARGADRRAHPAVRAPDGGGPLDG